MSQFVTGLGGRSTPDSRLLPRLAPVALALAVLFVPGAATPQNAPPQEAPPQTAPPQGTPPAKGDQPAPNGTAPNGTAPKPAPAPGERQGPGRGNRGPRAQQQPSADPTDLEGVMHGLKDNLKLLNGALASDDRKVALETVNEMERYAVLAKRFEPNNMAEIAEADKPAHVVAYRKELIALLGKLTEIETSVLDGKFAAALEIVKGPLLEMRDDAHDKFQAKKERR